MFDRFDLCDAYYLLESDYNVSGVLQERKSNQRRKMSTGYQLSRMGYKPSPLLSYETLSENAKDIYDNLCIQYGYGYHNIKTIKDIESLPEAILVDRNYDVLHILIDIGMLKWNSGDQLAEPETWKAFNDQEYHGLFVLLDDSGTDYKAVWGYAGFVPSTYKSLDLLWYDGKLMS